MTRATSWRSRWDFSPSSCSSASRRPNVSATIAEPGKGPPVAGTIEVKDLTKSFGSFRAVDNVSFSAAEGAITALLGPSGSGKSTVLRMIAGLEEPDSGRIFVAGEELTDASVQERRVGVVFPHHPPFRPITGGREGAFGLAGCREEKGGQTEGG